MKHNKDIKVTIVEHIDLEDRFMLKLKVEADNNEHRDYDDELEIKLMRENKKLSGFINTESSSVDIEKALLNEMVDKLAETKNNGFNSDRHSFMTGWFSFCYAVE